MLTILVLILTVIAIVLLIVDAIFMQFFLTILTIIFGVSAFFGWVFIAQNIINKNRTFMFVKKMMSLDRNNPKYYGLFTIFDYITGEENNLEVVKAVMENVYLFPKRLAKHPEKAKKKEMTNYLIEYYFTLTNDQLKVNFIWDYNKNFFTWKFISITTLVGVAGIITLYLCYNYIANPNDVLYTALYFLFGGFLLPLIAKFFGHFI